MGSPDPTIAALQGATGATGSELGSYVARLFQIESGGDPNARTGSNRGLSQFGPAEEQQFGINDQNRTDPNAQTAALTREAQLHIPILARTLGRQPTPGEMYLMHQQGIAGGPALFSNPDKPAWQVVRPFYSDQLAKSKGFASGDAMAKYAITGNTYKDAPFYGADPDSVKAGDFTSYWVNKFQRGTGGAPAMTAAAPAAGGAPSIAMAPAQPGAGTAPEQEALPDPVPYQEPEPLQHAQMTPLSPTAPAPMMAPNVGQHLRAALMARQGGVQPPSVAQRLAALMRRG